MAVVASSATGACRTTTVSLSTVTAGAGGVSSRGDGGFGSSDDSRGWCFGGSRKLGNCDVFRGSEGLGAKIVDESNRAGSATSFKARVNFLLSIQDVSELTFAGHKAKVCGGIRTVGEVDPVDVVDNEQSVLRAVVSSSIVDQGGVDVVGCYGASGSLLCAPGHKVDGKEIGSGNASEGGEG